MIQMSHSIIEATVSQRRESTSSAGLFVVAAVGLAAASAFLAGWAPLRFSIATVFLFAGPHNWLEGRYFLTRLPARWGRLRPFFVIGLGGALILTGAFAALPWVTIGYRSLAAAIWDTALIAWIAVLIQMRSRTNPRRDWSWTLPLAVAIIGVAWLQPTYVMLATIYLHPLIALWILDRELLRSKPEWHSAYRWCLACVPILLGILWWRLAFAPGLNSDDPLAARIIGHAGATVFPGTSTRLLVATHAFLEMLHYGVWVLAIPLVGLRAKLWQLGDVPLARRASSWRIAVAAGLIGSAFLVLALWACFAADYGLTRDVYFTVALVHVLAEAPFLLRAL
jgi:hypothetical protein